MEFDLSKIEFSKNDIRDKIRIPNSLNEELAYFLGFHVGDGYMKIERRKGRVDYRLQYAGHHENEFQWYIDHIKPLIKNIFNKNVEVRKTTTGTVKIEFRSKAIVSFLRECCQIPFSPKKNIVVPKIVQTSQKEIKSHFLRGLADTDFSLVFKNRGRRPTISHNTDSETLHNSVKETLVDLGFTFYSTTYPREREGTKLRTYCIEINGKKKLKQWIEAIGFSNYNTITRFKVWKKTGSLPTGTNIEDRIKILKNERPRSDLNRRPDG